MRWRLSHVAVLMTLILAAGVLSVQGLESYAGAASVPAAIVVDVPGLLPGSLLGLTGDRQEPTWFAVEATDELLSPFDRHFARRAALSGTSTLLLSTVPLVDETATRSAWNVLIAPDLPDPSDPTAQRPAPSAIPDAKHELLAAQRLAAFVVEQRGTRPFLAGLRLGDRTEDSLAPLLDALMDAAAALPSYRRTSIVLLGERLPNSGRRVALRYDTGRWEGHMRPGLADLLEDLR